MQNKFVCHHEQNKYSVRTNQNKSQNTYYYGRNKLLFSEQDIIIVRTKFACHLEQTK
jgi:hypothetical protein